MDYLKIDEVAAKWGISPRRLQTLCAQGKIDGATRFGRAWMIPKGTPKPVDGRTKAARIEKITTDMPMPRKTPVLRMTNLYHTPGCAEKAIAALSDNYEAQTLFAAEIAYARGQIDKVYDSANYLLQKHSGFYAVISGGMLLAQCAIWRGDLQMWRKAKIHISEANAKDDREREIITLRYGLEGEPMPQWQVAQRLGISRSYVSRLETRALGLLRRRYERPTKFR